MTDPPAPPERRPEGRPGDGDGNCHAKNLMSCQLNDEEKKKFTQVEKLKQKYVGDSTWCPVDACNGNNQYQRAWCLAVGFENCLIALRVYNYVQGAAPMPIVNGKRQPLDDVWNREHHGLWMAMLVEAGIPREQAEMLGYAHEMDAWEPDSGIAETRRDLRNNAVGRQLGLAYLKGEYQSLMNGWATNGGYLAGDYLINGPHHRPSLQEVVVAAAGGDCSTICFS